jgi:hypothetical protein
MSTKLKLSVDGKAPEVGTEYLEATLRKVNEENRQLKYQLGERSEFYKAVVGAIRPIPAPTPPTKEKNGHKPSATLCVVLTDWHTGEIVDSRQMGESNAYSWAIQERDLNNIVDRMLKWSDVLRNGYTINDAVVFTLGDMVSGEIHDDLRIHNEFPTPIAVAKAGMLLATTYAKFCTKFQKVRACQVGGGNHDRLTMKPHSKQTIENSYAHLVHEIANLMMANAKNFSHETPIDYAPVFEVAGHHIAATHGDCVKMQGRTPYYGFSRYISQYLRDRLDRKLPPIEKFLFGHFHHYAELEDGIAMLCPSLIGQSEWSRKMGLLGKGGQVAFLVGDKGIFHTVVFRRK